MVTVPEAIRVMGARAAATAAAAMEATLGGTPAREPAPIPPGPAPSDAPPCVRQNHMASERLMSLAADGSRGGQAPYRIFVSHAA